MYLIINGTRHTVSRRIVTADTIKYLSVTPAPEEISGKAQMYTDGDFLLSEDNLDSFSRKQYTGTLLTVTNKPEPVPQPYVPTIADRVADLEQAVDMILTGYTGEEETTDETGTS